MSESAKYYDSNGRRLTDAQARFFWDSAVRDDQGRLLVCYHGTASDFDTFGKGDVGFHFGTSAQANARLSNKYGSVANGKRILPVYIDIRNPLRLKDDPQNFDPEFLLMELANDDVSSYFWYDGPRITISDAEKKELSDRFGFPVRNNIGPNGLDAFSDWDESNYEGKFEDYESELADSVGLYDVNDEARDRLVKILEGAGYDGIVYPNAWETENGDFVGPVTGGDNSWVAFRPNQIKSVFNADPKETSPKITEKSTQKTIFFGKGRLEEGTLRMPNGVQMYVTESPYEAKDIIRNSRIGLRVVYDPNIGVYAMGDVDRCIHFDLLQELAKSGWYAEQMDELGETNVYDFLERYVDFDKAQEAAVYLPDECDSETSVMDLIWDHYRYIEAHPDFTVVSRNPTQGGALEKVFGKPTKCKDLHARKSMGEAYEPIKTGKAYKVFRVKNGKLYPPMVANAGGRDTPIGVWLDAEEGEFAGLSKTGRPQVKSTGSGTLSYRPGWHLGDLPRAPQFDRTNKETGEKEFPSDFVWAECDYAMDVDYQPEADARGYERTKMGDDGKVVTYKSDKYQHSLAGLPKLPAKGYYRYRTNPNPETVPWVITGSIRVNRLLSDDEVNAILKDNGVAPIHRQGGDKTLAELGLSESLSEATGSHLKGEYDYGDVHSYLESEFGFSDDIPEVMPQLIDKDGRFCSMSPKSKPNEPLFHGEILQAMEADGIVATGDSLLDKVNLTNTDLFQQLGFIRCNRGSEGYHYMALPDVLTANQVRALKRYVLDSYSDRRALIEISGRGEYVNFMVNDDTYPICGHVDDLLRMLTRYANGRRLRMKTEAKLSEEWLDDEHGIWMTESQYEVANMMRNSKHSLRILWDRNLKLFFVCDADLYIHRDMIEQAVEDGLYQGVISRWGIDSYVDDYGRNVIYYIFAPKGLEKETYGADVNEDGYEGKYVYPFGTVTTRSDDRYKSSPLAKALGKYEAHYVQDGWVDDYTPKVVQVESMLTEVYPNEGESKKDFVSRFMSATKDEYPDTKQRYAVALSYWDRAKRKNESLLTEKKRGELISQSKKGADYSKNNQSKGRNRWERRMHSRVANSVRDYDRIDMNALWKADILEFGVKVHGETDDYVVTITFEKVLDNLRQEVRSNGNKMEFKCVLRALMRSFNDDDVFISCSCLHPSTKIKLLDGTCPTVAEMKERFDKGEQLYVYSTDENGDFKPGVVEKVWITKKATDFIKVTLDDGSEILTTPDHPYMLRDGSYALAEDLTEGQSLMPMYFNEANGYETYKPNTLARGWKSVYKAVAEYFKHDEMVEAERRSEQNNENMNYKVAIHHVDFNKRNNNPENLRIMTAREHWDYHASLCGPDRPISDRSREVSRENAYKRNAHPTERMNEARKKFLEKGIAHNYDPEWKPKQAEIMRKVREKYYANWTHDDYSRVAKERITDELKGKISEAHKKLWSEMSEEEYERRCQINHESNMRAKDKISKKQKEYWSNMDADEKARRVKNLIAHAYRPHGPLSESHKQHIAEAKMNMSKEKKAEKALKTTRTKSLKVFNEMISRKLQFTEENYESVRLDMLSKNKHLGLPKLEKAFSSIEEAVTNFGLNHKVAKVERVTLEETPVYDVKVKDWNNFVVDAGVVLHNCPDWKYRFSYQSTIGRYNSGLPELRPSDITNPNNDKGAGCKHSLLVLSNTDWMVKIASVINNYARYCQKNMQKNYADYIFPKIYGMPYKKAVQLSLFDDMDPEKSGLLPSDQKALSDVIELGMRGKDEKGRFEKGNDYRFSKSKPEVGTDQEDENPLELRFDNNRRKTLREPEEEEG